MKMLRTIPALPVRILSKSLVFYTKKLGFSLAHEEEKFAIVKKDEVEVHLWVANDESWRTRAHDAPVSTGAESFIAGTASCRIEVTGIHEYYDALKQHGIIHPNGPLQEQPWGDRDFSVIDPDNNLITFFQRIS